MSSQPRRFFQGYLAATRHLLPNDFRLRNMPCQSHIFIPVDSIIFASISLPSLPTVPLTSFIELAGLAITSISSALASSKILLLWEKLTKALIVVSTASILPGLPCDDPSSPPKRFPTSQLALPESHLHPRRLHHSREPTGWTPVLILPLLRMVQALLFVFPPLLHLLVFHTPDLAAFAFPFSTHQVEAVVSCQSVSACVRSWCRWKESLSLAWLSRGWLLSGCDPQTACEALGLIGPQATRFASCSK